MKCAPVTRKAYETIKQFYNSRDVRRSAAHWFYIVSKIFFTTTWQAVWESGKLQKDGEKQEYPNLFWIFSREDNLIAWRTIWVHCGDPYPKANWQRYRVTVAYISVLLKDVMLLTSCRTFQSFACWVSIRLWLNKIQKWRFKKRVPVHLIREIQLPWKTVTRQNREI